MKVLVINPNSTQSMTDKIQVAAIGVAPSDVTVLSRTSAKGPISIQGPEDGILALPGLLDEVEKGVSDGMDAFIIACFDDTGLDEARAITSRPVIGIGEAAFHASMMKGHSFSVVTTLSVSVPVIEENIARYGVRDYCRKVRASEVPVLDLEKPGSEAERKISDEIGVALKEDQCGAIVLGCAGMTDLASRLASEHGIPVVDGVVSAVGFASALARL